MTKNLTSPRQVREILDKFGITLSRKFSQNFLIDKNILEKIMVAVCPEKEDNLLEVGPGIGTLTVPLAQKSRLVVAVEIDRRLFPVMKETLAEQTNIRVINADILKIDLKNLYDQEFGAGVIKVVSNLPYYVTTPFLFKILSADLPIVSLTLMLQQEAARRLVARLGTKDYGVLTLLVQYYCEVDLLFRVPASVFFPRPKVESAVISLIPRKIPPVEVPDTEFFFNLIRASFQQRRKTLTNALEKMFPGRKETLQEIIRAAGISPSIRGEALSLEQFAILSKFLYNSIL